MGRNAQPVDIILAKGKKHLTKAEIEQRKKSEIKLGTKNFKCPKFVKNDKEAYKKWKELIKDYKEAAEENIEIISSTDLGLLAKYCKTFSEYLKLLDRRDKIDNIDFIFDEDHVVEKEIGEKAKEDLFKKINYIISTEGILKLETAVNKKMDMLIKMEDRLFLNPLAKVKNVPKSKEEEKPVNKFTKFVR